MQKVVTLTFLWITGSSAFSTFKTHQKSFLDTPILDERPFEQRASGPRPARRLNHGFKYLYRHDFNESAYPTDPVHYLMQEGGYTEQAVYAMNFSFPPLLNLSVPRQLHPKMRFLKETIGVQPGKIYVPPQYFGARLERTLAPRHAFLMHWGLPHGRQLFETLNSRNETLFQDFLLACRKTKQFVALCHDWQKRFGAQAADGQALSSKQVEAFDALFSRGLMAAARDELVQLNNTWPLDYINVSSAEMIRLLIHHGAQAHERDYRGVSLLHWAAGAGNLRGLEALLPHAPESIWIRTERDAATPLHWAAAGVKAREFGTGGHVHMCRYLLEQISSTDEKRKYVNERTRDGNSPVMWAAWAGSLETVQLLVRHRAAVDVANRNGCTVAHWAASGGNVEVCKYLANVVGVDFTQPNYGGNTPLTHAVAFGRAQVVEWLKNVILKDSEDATAYNLAQDFVIWTNGDERRNQVLQLFDDWSSFDQTEGKSFEEDGDDQPDWR